MIDSDARFHPIDRGQHGGGVYAPATTQPRNSTDHSGRARTRILLASSSLLRLHPIAVLILLSSLSSNT